MSLLNMPLEILTIIIRNLDTKSVYNLYESCEFFKNVIRISGLIQECQFSMSTLATVKSLDLDFFRDISEHLIALNLYGIKDLSISPVLQALKCMTHLEDLDVSYTNIIMLHFLDIMAARPTLKALAISFKFDEEQYRFTTDLLLKYQDACKGLEDVHFIGSEDDLLHGYEAFFILNKCNLHTYRITIFGDDFVYTRNSDNEEEYMMEVDEQENWPDITVLKKVSYLNIYIAKGCTYCDIFDLPICEIMGLNLVNYEIILMHTHITPKVVATPLMKKFISDNFNVEVNDITELYTAIYGEVNLMVWNKEFTQFDSKFYINLLKALREFLPLVVDPSNIDAIPNHYKWSIAVVDPQYTQTNLEFHLLDVSKGKDVKLKLVFTGNIFKPIVMKYDLLERLTYLMLVGEVQYTPEFFRNLFLNAHSLVTLCISNPIESFSVLKMLEFLPKCTSLKNILLLTYEIPFFPLFGYLSACRNIENIILMSNKRSFHRLPNPTSLFRNCTNLYCLYIKADMKSRLKILEVYEKIKLSLGRYGLTIDIERFSGLEGDSESPDLYRPFNIYTLEPVKKLA